MTNEFFSHRADSGMVLGSTIERKKMSIKTLRKRIALVAVAALAVTGLSTVPANAAVLPNGTATAITLSTITASPTVGTAVDIKMGTTVAALVATTTADTLTFQGALTAFPAGGSTSVAGILAANQTPAGTATPITPTASTATTSVVAGGNLRVTTTGTTAWDAQTVTYLGGFRFTPTKAGVHTVTVWVDTDTDGVVDPVEVSQTLNITVAAAAGFSTATSQLYSQLGANTDAANATDNLVPLLMTKTLATATRANITVNLFDSSGVAMTSGNTITATITGVGGFSSSLAVTADVPTATDCNATSNPRVKTGAADAVNNLSICSDGTAGTGTVTIEVTDAAGVTRTLGTKTITFYGDAAKLAVSSQPINVLVAGGATSGVKTGITGATLAASPAFVVKVTDANGNPVSGLTSSLTGVSANAAQVSAVSNNEGTVANDANGVYGGAGHYVFDATSSANAVSSATPTVVTIRMIDPAGDGTTYLTTTVSFTVGGSATKIALSTDKASYAPGDQGTLTLTATDSSGNPVSDRARDLLGSTGLTASKGVQGSLPTAASVETKKGVKTYTFFAPVSGGAFTISGTVGTGAAAAAVGAAISASASVADPMDATIASLVAAIAKLQKAINKINKRLAR